MDWCSLYYRTKFWVTDFFKGSPIGKHYREVKYLSTHNASDTVAYREKKLKEFLKYVSTNSPFYRSYLGRSLSYFPVVNKSILLENYDEIRIPQDKYPAKRENCIFNLPPVLQARLSQYHRIPKKGTEELQS